MNNNITDEKNYLTELISLKKVGERINLRNIKSVKKWLDKNNISIHKFSKDSFIYQVDYDFHIQKPFVLSLRRKYPNHWKEMYHAICVNEALFNMMMIEMEQQTPTLPTTRIKVKSKEDENILKNLLG